MKAYVATPVYYRMRTVYVPAISGSLREAISSGGNSSVREKHAIMGYLVDSSLS